MSLEVGEWYWDAELRQALRLLEVHDDTVKVVDARANVRLVNRALFERDMRAVSAVMTESRGLNR